MSFRRVLSLGLQALLAVAVLSLILGSALGQPILLGFVETGSAESTIAPVNHSSTKTHAPQ
jgi:signal peptidase